jgi:cell division septal protein FtsQ
VSPVAAPADRRFRRAHVKPSRSRGRLRTVAARSARYALIAAIVVYGVYRGGAALAQSDMLRVDNIVVHGNRRFSSGEVVAMLTGLRGEHIIWTDLAAWRERLLASAWLRDAALRRSLPSTVEVFVSEREPIAIGRIGADLYLIDDRGVVIADYGPQYADLDLPIIDGLGGKTGAGDVARAELAARLLAAVRPDPEVARRISQVDVSNVRNASVILTDDPAVLYVGDDRFLPRLQSYLELAAALKERVPAIDYVDLRFDDRVYVREAGKRKVEVGR